eukprot:jgi/Chlat1/3417/Chrsp23S03820
MYPDSISLPNSRVVVPSNGSYVAGAGVNDVGLVLKDRFGNDPVSTPGAVVVVFTQAGVSQFGSVSGGVVAANITRSGMWSVTAYVVGSPLAGSGSVVTVVPAVQSPVTSFISGAGTKDGVAGSALSVVVYVNDAFGNAITLKSLNVSVNVRALAGVYIKDMAAALQTASGTHATSSYTLTVADTYVVSVTAGGILLATLTTLVSPAAISLPDTDIIGDINNVINGTAGVPSSFQLQFRDVYSNNISSTGHSFVGSTLALGSLVVGLNKGISLSSPVGSGPVLCAYTLTTAGKYDIRVVIDGQTVPMQGISLSVGPDIASASASYVLGLFTAGRVGSVAGFGVILRDKYNNFLYGNSTMDALTVNAVIATGSGASVTSSPLPVRQLFDSTQGYNVISMTPTKPGLLTVSVYIGGSHTTSSPFAAQISAGDTDATQCLLYGPGLTGAVVQISATFTIQAFDIGGNVKNTGGEPFGVSVNDGNGRKAASKVDVVDNKDGTYDVTYTPTVAGTVYVAVTLQGGNVGNSPVSVTVRANSALTDYSRTLVTGVGYTYAVAGVNTSFNIVALDSNGAQQTTGGAKYVVTATPTLPTIIITDMRNGVYTVSYIATKAGVYTLVLTSPDYNNNNTIKSGNLTVVAAAASASNCRLATGFATWYHPGDHISAELDKRDAYDNKWDNDDNEDDNGNGSDDDDCRVDVVNSAGSNVANGRVKRSYKKRLVDVVITQPGVYMCSVTVGGSNIPGSPFLVNVVPGPISPSDTKLGTNVGSLKVVAGVAGNINVLASDEDGFTTTNVTQCNVGLVDANGTSIAQVACNLTSMVISYNVTKAGVYTLYVNVSSVSTPGSAQPIQGSPFVGLCKVVPADINPKSCTATGMGLISATAGVKSTFSITAKDAFGNKYTTNTAGIPFAVAIQLNSLSVASGTVTDIDSVTGFYTASYVVSNAGTYAIAVTSFGQHIQGSPFSVVASAAATSADKSFVSTTLPGGSFSAGVLKVATITAVDISGVPQTQSVGQAFSVDIAPAVATDAAGKNVSTGAYVSNITDNNNGTYTFYFRANKTNTYRGLTPTLIPYQLSVTLKSSSSPLSNSPIQFGLVAAADPDPSKCYIVQLATTYTFPIASSNPTALETPFSIVVSDAFGNVKGLDLTQLVSFKANVTAADTNMTLGGSTTTVVRAGDGTYTVLFDTLVAGRYVLSVTLNNILVGGNTTSFAVLPGPSALSKYTVDVGDGVTRVATAGVPATITIQPRDAFGNAQRDANSEYIGNIKVTMSVRVGSGSAFTTFTGSQAISGLSVLPGSLGTYIVYYTPIKSGTLVTAIDISTQAISRSPFNGTVQAGVISAPNCTADVTSTATINKPANITLTPVDALGNPIDNITNTICANFIVSFPNNTTTISLSAMTTTSSAKCQLSYTSTAIGPANATITYNNLLISNGRVSVVILADTTNNKPTPDASQSVATGPALNGVSAAGSEIKIVVGLRDSKGGVITTSQGVSFVALNVTHTTVPATQVTYKVGDNLDGTYTFSFTPTKTGVYKLVPLVNGTALGVKGNYYNVTVVSGPTSTAQVSITPSTVRAGESLTVMLSPFDTYGNAQDRVVNGNNDVYAANISAVSTGAVLPVTLTWTGNNSVSGSAILNQLDQYSVSVTLKGVKLGSTTTVTVVAGGVYGPNTVIGGTGLTTCTSGVVTAFWAKLYDRMNNVVTDNTTYTNTLTNVTAQFVSLANNTSPLVIPVKVAVDSANVRYNISYNATIAGKYAFQLAVNGVVVAITGYQYTTVSAGSVNSALCTAAGQGVQNAVNLTAGQISTFQITARDNYNNINVGGDSAFVAKGDVVFNPTTGLYDATYAVTSTGTYVVDVTRLGTNIQGSPFPATNKFISVLAGAIDNDNSKVSGNGTLDCVAGDNIVVEVQAYDKYNNTRTDTNDNIFYAVGVTSGSALEQPSGTMSPLGNGRYNCKYSCRTAGSKNRALTLTFASSQGNKKVYTLSTSPGTVSPSNSTLAGDITTINVGYAASATITAFDSFGNKVTLGNNDKSTYNLQITDSTGQDVKLTESVDNTGAMDYEYTITKAGKYKITATYVVSAKSVLTIYNGTLTVMAGRPSAQYCVVTVPDSAKTNTLSSFSVQLRDKYSNIIMDASYITNKTMQLTNAAANSFSSSNCNNYYWFCYLYNWYLNNRDGWSDDNNNWGYYSSTTNNNINTYTTTNAGSVANLTYTVTPVTSSNTYTIAFTPTIEGKAVIAWTISDSTGVSYPVLDLDDSPFGFDVTSSVKKSSVSSVSATTAISTSNIVSATRSLALDNVGTNVTDGVVFGAVAGEEFDFFIRFRDEGGSDITQGGDSALLDVSLSPGLGGDVVSVVDLGNGTYAVRFTAKVAQAYLAEIIVAGQPLGNTGQVAVVVLLHPDGLSPFSPSPVVAGSVTRFTVRARDAFGNQATYSWFEGRDPFSATLSGPEELVAAIGDNRDGTYNVTFAPIIAGAYSLTVTLNGLLVGGIANGNFTFVVSEAAFDASQSHITSNNSSLTSLTAAVPVVLYLSARDGYGNVYTRGDVDVAATLTPDTGNETAVSATVVLAPTPGVYVVTLVPTLAGLYSLQVTGNEAILSGFPVKTTVLAGAVNQKTSSVIITKPPIAGQLSIMSIIARDVAGNVNDTLPSVVMSPEPEDLTITRTCNLYTATCTATMSYVPVMAGNMTVSVTVGGVHITSSSLAISVTPASAPGMVSAQLSVSLTAVVIDLNEGTNRPGNMCDDVLSTSTLALIGAGADCWWKDDNTYVVSLGDGAMIKPGSFISLKKGVVTNADGNSYAASNTIQLSEPSVTASPLISLSAPDVIGACDGFEAVAYIAGSGGRAVSTSWFIQGEGAKMSTLTAKVRNLALDQTAVTFAADEMDFGVTYNITVAATNYLGKTSQESVLVTKSLRPSIPVVTIDFSSVGIEVSGGSDTTLYSHVIEPSQVALVDNVCVLDNTANNEALDFRWVVTDGPVLNLFDTFPSVHMATVHTPTLTIPAGYLLPGQAYAFSLTVTARSDPTLTSTDAISVSVASSPLQSRIRYGDRVVQASHPLLLEGASIDITASPAKFQYSWFISAAEGSSTSVPSAAISAIFAPEDDDIAIGAVATIPANTLPEGVYVVTLATTKEPLTTLRVGVLATAIITVKASGVIPVTVISPRDPDTATISSSDELLLACEADIIDTSDIVSYSWALSTDAGALAPISAYTDDAESDILIIKPGTLPKGQSVKFACSVSGSKSASVGFAAISLRVRGDPSGCKLSVTPDVGSPPYVAGETDFNIVVSGCAASMSADDGSVVYEYRYKVGVSGVETLISPFTTNNRHMATLPAGNSVSIVVYVKDPNPASSNPNGLPEGLQLISGAFDIGEGNRRRLLSDIGDRAAAQKAANFDVAVRTLDTATVLADAQVWASLYSDTSNGYQCNGGDEELMTLTSAMVSDIAALDTVTLFGNELAMMEVCALASLISNPAELSSSTATSALTLISTQLNRIATTSDTLEAPSSPGADTPYTCYADALNNYINIAACDGDANQHVAGIADMQTTLGRVMVQQDLPGFPADTFTRESIALSAQRADNGTVTGSVPDFSFTGTIMAPADIVIVSQDVVALAANASGDVVPNIAAGGMFITDASGSSLTASGTITFKNVPTPPAGSVYGVRMMLVSGEQTNAVSVVTYTQLAKTVTAKTSQVNGYFVLYYVKAASPSSPNSPPPAHTPTTPAPSPTPPVAPKATTSKTGVIAGTVIGGGTLVGVSALVLVLGRRRRQRRGLQQAGEKLNFHHFPLEADNDDTDTTTAPAVVTRSISTVVGPTIINSPRGAPALTMFPESEEGRER